MENLYDILECDPSVSQEEVKRCYVNLVLKFHPDKSRSEDSAAFIKLKRAWDVLGNPVLRREYDARWKERCLVQDLPVQEEVECSEFELIESCCSYCYPCRCGGDFILSEAEAKFHYDIVCCEICSLTVRVLYTDAGAASDSADPCMDGKSDNIS